MQKLVTLRGVVVPAGWDAAGRVRAVAIAAFDESEYLVGPGGEGDRLKALLHREVTVSGRLVRDRDRPEAIQVERIINGYAADCKAAVQPAFEHHPCLVLI